MKTVKLGRKTHLLSWCDFDEDKYVVHTFCKEDVTRKTKPVMGEVPKTVPTCEKCVKEGFVVLNEWLKEAKTDNKNISRKANTDLQIARCMSNLINNQKRALDIKRHNDGMTYKDGSYVFIPHGIQRTMSHFLSLSRRLFKDERWSGFVKKGTKFLDAGCGIGNIMAIARQSRIADICHGIEFDKDTARRARMWLSIDVKRKEKPESWEYASQLKVIKGDILTFKNYADYDVIYYYSPFCNPVLEALFEELVEDSMQVGAVIIPKLKKSKAVLQDKRFVRIKTPEFPAEPAFIKIGGGKRKRSDIIGKKTIKRNLSPELLKRYSFLLER